MGREHAVNRKEKKKEEDGTGFFWTYFFILQIIVAIILICFSTFMINDFVSNIKQHNPNYSWPKITELIPSLFILPFIIILKTGIEYCSKGFVEHCLANKYKHPKNEEYKKLGMIYRHKLARHIYKIVFYVGLTIFGYVALLDLPYFPKSLLGNGYMSNILNKGFPDCYFYERTPLFNLYYNINLAYFLSDAIFLFIMERQSDFVNMILHHLCTISLILFSFLVNYSNVGVLVLFLHIESDILLHATRFLIQTDNSQILVGFVGLLFTFNFVYMRQYVLGEIIYTMYIYGTWKWVLLEKTLWWFLVFLYIMHLRWSYILVSKAIQMLFCKTKISDDINYNKLIHENKNKDYKKMN